ncbi:hypothetical protein Pmani_006818 [Petrolisthes manimaculis]|uniref:Uncharacterized protein n=1 Tax=Petrolisthes manimaculis TaxID=1843537 RepID=A0AAE1Q9N9_9EUCA|nr:hypothetical protein Pmani_006818 [Petrolisthes manimaculis]
MGTLFVIPWALGWLPESPRWLITQARFQEALKVLKWAAKVNRNTLPSDDVILDVMSSIKKQSGYLYLDYTAILLYGHRDRHEDLGFCLLKV